MDKHPPQQTLHSTQNPISHLSHCNRLLQLTVDRESSVGVATSYGLDGPGIEFRWMRDFPHPSIPALGSTQPILTLWNFEAYSRLTFTSTFTSTTINRQLESKHHLCA